MSTSAASGIGKIKTTKMKKIAKMWSAMHIIIMLLSSYSSLFYYNHNYNNSFSPLKMWLACSPHFCYKRYYVLFTWEIQKNEMHYQYHCTYKREMKNDGKKERKKKEEK